MTNYNSQEASGAASANGGSAFEAPPSSASGGSFPADWYGGERRSEDSLLQRDLALVLAFTVGDMPPLQIHSLQLSTWV